MARNRSNFKSTTKPEAIDAFIYCLLFAMRRLAVTLEELVRDAVSSTPRTPEEAVQAWEPAAMAALAEVKLLLASR